MSPSDDSLRILCSDLECYFILSQSEGPTSLFCVNVVAPVTFHKLAQSLRREEDKRAERRRRTP
jgi:hypothetical protein